MIGGGVSETVTYATPTIGEMVSGVIRAGKNFIEELKVQATIA